MSNEDIVSKIIEYAYEVTSDLSDEDYMEVLYDVSATLKGSADAKEEELEDSD